MCVCKYSNVKVMDFYLFQFRQSQRVVIFDSELHKTHVGRMCELCDDTKPWKQSAKQEYKINYKKKEKKKLSQDCIIVIKQTWKVFEHWL